MTNKCSTTIKENLKLTRQVNEEINLLDKMEVMKIEFNGHIVRYNSIANIIEGNVLDEEGRSLPEKKFLEHVHKMVVCGNYQTEDGGYLDKAQPLGHE